MSQSWILFQNVSFTYETAGSPLLEGLSLHFPFGWTGIVGANGVGKTTLLRLATGGLEPRCGDIVIPGRSVYCPQRTDDPPERLAEFLADSDGEACALRGRLGVEAEWLDRWGTLSHGERKRAQIGTALWLRPEALALDEPTNHIDADARDLLASALSTYQGAGLLVSHDRQLLDALCRQCLFVEPPSAVMRPGGYTEAVEQERREDEHKRRERRTAKTAYARLRRTAIRRREQSERAHRMRSKRGLNIKDHDARAKKDLARVTGKDGQAGRLLNQLAGRVRQAEERLQTTRVKKVQTLGIWVAGERSQRDCVLQLPEGAIPLGANRMLSFPDLLLQPDGRVALTGPNGSGKSTLIAHIMKHLNVPRGRVTYLPQEIDLETSQRVLSDVRRLPHEQLGRAMTVVSRLNSRPERLLESEAPSPGEIRKLLLALGIARGPHFIIMDEPTNHLDLPSIECLESALSDCPCALLLVSHDRRFLEGLTTVAWRIVPKAEGTRLIVGH